MDDRILVLVPCYNCGAQVGRVLGQFCDVPAGTFAEVLVLDNGSKDGTIEAALAAMDRVSCCPVTVARNRANYNLGGSHKAAFAYAVARRCTHVAVLHGDDQGRIADLLPILGSGRHRTHAACLGARFMPGSVLDGYSSFRVFGNHVFNALFTLIAGTRICDLGSGLNIFGREIFAAESVRGYSDDLRFNIYLLLDAIDRRRSLMYFPISWREDDQISNVRMLSQARRTLDIAAQYLFRRSAFRSLDHRDVRHADYAFDVVRSSAEALAGRLEAGGAR